MRYQLETWNIYSPSNSTSLPTRPITLLPIFFKLCPFFLYFVLGKICILPITLKLLEILPWNLKYIFTIKIYIITNNTHNPASNIFQVMPLFHLNCVLSKIYTWPITLKLLELSPWNLEYVFIIKIYVIINKNHNSATSYEYFSSYAPLSLMQLSHNIETTGDITLKLGIYVCHQFLNHYNQHP